MKIHHLRNATFVIESGSHHILIDPMLSHEGELPPFARFRHKPKKNPTVPLPDTAPQKLDKVTHCLITHSQTFGIKAFQHTDHLDARGEAMLRDKQIPVVCRIQDAPYLKKYGINVMAALYYGKSFPLLNGQVTAIRAQHGRGWIRRFMANGAGFYLQLANEPSIYISGDTVYTDQVDRALAKMQPDIAVVAAGSARMDLGKPVLMTLDEVVTFVRNAPHSVMANHLEALNHCPTTRAQLKERLGQEGLLDKTFIPDDGETIEVN